MAQIIFSSEFYIYKCFAPFSKKVSWGCHHFQHKDTQHNDIQHYDTKLNVLAGPKASPAQDISGKGKYFYAIFSGHTSTHIRNQVIY
jgi:hypothetical protein